MFKDPFSFNGRIGRLEYGLSYVGFILYVISIRFVVGLFIGILIGMKIIPYPDKYQMKVMYCVACIPVFYVLIAQSVKRCHDQGNSGWWILMPFYNLWMLFADGELVDNEYGENPKG